LFVAVHESACRTTQSIQSVLAMSVHWGEPVASASGSK
jgi:hypothetical protein